MIAKKKVLAGPLKILDSLSSSFLIAVLLAVGRSGSLLAEGEPAAYATWLQAEQSKESQAFRARMAEGESLDEASKKFLQETALPQLAVDANRPTIERTRRRMREILFNNIDDQKTHDAVSQLVLNFMAQLARDNDVEPVVQVNAMLLIGELKSKDGKPWLPAVAPLARDASDPQMPMANRIAAVVGLTRHVEALVKADDAAVESLAQTVVPAILKILAEPAGMENAVEADWIASRAAGLVPILSRISSSKEVARAIGKSLNDPKRSLDTRIRLAAVLAATAKKGSGVDVAKTIDSIRALAIESLEEDKKVTDIQQFEREYRNFFTGVELRQPVEAALEETIHEQIYRRAAWRLVCLADAVLSADSKTGLSLLGGEPSHAARQLATILRESGFSLDANPTTQSLLESLAALQAPADPGPGGIPSNPNAQPADPQPVKPSAVPNNPFGP